MDYILNIETATKNCSVALATAGKTILCKEISEEGFKHAERLHVFIQDLFLEVGINYNELIAVAVSQGPGSYTGLRIGVSAAKGFCYALNLPLIAIDTLQVLASQAKIIDGLIIPLLDARRMEVYSAIFNPDLANISETKAEVITENSFETITEKVYFVGDCIAKCQSVLDKPNFNFLEQVKYPSSNDMSALSFSKFQMNDFVDLAYFEPLYLKDFLITTSKKVE